MVSKALFIFDTLCHILYYYINGQSSQAFDIYSGEPHIRMVFLQKTPTFQCKKDLESSVFSIFTRHHLTLNSIVKNSSKTHKIFYLRTLIMKSSVQLCFFHLDKNSESWGSRIPQYLPNANSDPETESTDDIPVKKYL